MVQRAEGGDSSSISKISALTGMASSVFVMQCTNVCISCFRTGVQGDIGLDGLTGQACFLYQRGCGNVWRQDFSLSITFEMQSIYHPNFGICIVHRRGTWALSIRDFGWASAKQVWVSISLQKQKCVSFNISICDQPLFLFCHLHIMKANNSWWDL